jgi:hypothetical protein
VDDEWKISKSLAATRLICIEDSSNPQVCIGSTRENREERGRTPEVAFECCRYRFRSWTLFGRPTTCQLRALRVLLAPVVSGCSKILSFVHFSSYLFSTNYYYYSVTNFQDLSNQHVAPN